MLREGPGEGRFRARVAMADLLLTPDEVRDLTGYRQPAKQVAVLRQQGVPFFLNAAGHPKVARAVIEGRQPAEPQRKSWSPSWAATPR